MISNFFKNRNNIYVLLLSLVIGTILIFSLMTLSILGVDNPISSEILKIMTITLIWPYFLAALLDSFMLALILETIYVFIIIKFMYLVYLKLKKLLAQHKNTPNESKN